MVLEDEGFDVSGLKLVPPVWELLFAAAVSSFKLMWPCLGFMSVTCYVAVCRFINLMPGVMSMLTIGFQVNFDSGSGLL